ncbi:hypothetical protein PsorP6_017066 [Peronosclerospora sorghi]|uniref:Uncharacterized protein n=1 Tax=Peronosclerospora sorghi TaxID=230839 RepID=A0ACC0WDI3_9STRA|nr:hypothetical protein PsorP6_017066 [Peronosclerospora sorghi]
MQRKRAYVYLDVRTVEYIILSPPSAPSIFTYSASGYTILRIYSASPLVPCSNITYLIMSSCARECDIQLPMGEHVVG